jgi:hypothetical protein
MAVFWDIAPVVSNMTNVSEMCAASIIKALMMEAVHISETSV